MTGNVRSNYDVDLLKKGIGGWRKLYAQFVEKIKPKSIIEFGAGRPDFLQSIDCPRKVAIDYTNTFESEFLDAGIEFYTIDLDTGILPNLGLFDIVICSDVFEHLRFPDIALKYAHELLNDNGLLFSHVPNEFTFNKTIKIMLGMSESLYFHKHCEEYNDPHLHRFTRIGFQKFLEQQFLYNIYIYPTYEIIIFKNLFEKWVFPFHMLLNVVPLLSVQTPGKSLSQ
ncbi:SAM-dependent methyltransferase [Methanocalculus sp. AMF5]|uniref:class I SAM-dependent methyltransferase n=1 Tax=Methanocalculus sp. AMF5 TaxID=1198257 RepID=UPI00209F5C9E|nr:methyltransferase domain-containing protein [Methanocalculus sp. AMF5]MCP1663164.1 SAM-dependent methyltransferase [Methanocalculus sp. AMF5]